MRRLLQVARVVGVIGVAVIAACSSSNSSTGTSPISTSSASSPVLRDEYEPTGTVPESGGITQIAFYDATTYSLRRTQGPNAPELIAYESGTYTLDVTAETLTLTPTGGTAKSYPFKVSTTASASTSQSTGLRLQGLGDFFNEIISFIFNGQTFESDSPPASTGSASSSSDSSGDDSSSDGSSSGDSSGNDSSNGSSSDNSSSSGASTGGASSGSTSSGGASSGTSSSGTGSTHDAGSGSACVEVDAGAPPPTGTGNGIDVSHYQGTIAWSKVEPIRQFAYAKATEGTAYTDTKFATYWSGMKSAGIARGAYHFFRASKSGKAQADYFANELLSHGYDASSDLAPMVDVEVTDGVSASALVSGLRAFVTEAQAKLGVTLIVYTGPSFWTHTIGNPDFSANPLWIAQYTSASHPAVPSHWSKYTIWQFSQSIPVTGVGSPGVDNDRWNGATSRADASVPPKMSHCVADAGSPKDASDASSPKDANDGGIPDATKGGIPDAAEGGIPDATDGGIPSIDAGDAGLIPGTCTHDVCTAGTALGQACNSCTMKICAVDPYCCDTLWGPSCFPDVMEICGMTCN